MAYHRYNPHDEPSAPDGDLGFIGVEMRYHPSQLPGGYAADAMNCRFRNGVAETRKGSVKLGWTNKVTATGIEPWGTVYGRGLFVDASLVEWLITAADGNIYASRANNATLQLTLPAAVTVTQSCHFEQANSTLVLMRGLDADPLQLTDLAEGFTVVPDPEVTDAGLSAMPRGIKSVWIANRLWVQTANDQVWASDELDIHTYDESRKFKIDQGAADPLVTIIPFGRTDIICLKRHSVFRLTNIVGDLTGTQALPITRRYGCLAPKSAVDIGTDLIWWSDEGIASLTLTEFGELQASEGKLKQQAWFSDPIQPLIQRVKGAYAANIVSTVWNRHLYVAVPLDSAASFGPELVHWSSPIVPQYFFGSFVVSGLIPGRTYRYIKQVEGVGDDLSLTNGTETVTNSGDFTAQGATVTLNSTGINGVSIGASLREVFKGANTAILVYNFNTAPSPGESRSPGHVGAWSGYDQGAEIVVKDMFLATFANQQRLFLISPNGFVTLYEERWADQLGQPFIDIYNGGPNVVGDTLQVNGGTTVTAIAGLTGDATHWAIDGGLATVGLWTHNAEAGFYPGASTPWSAPNTIAVRTIEFVNSVGVRFYATNGILPTFSYTGTWPLIYKVTQAQIETRLVTRGYLLGRPLDRKRCNDLTLAIQTWDPTYTISVINEGVAREDIIASAITRDRTKFTEPFNAPAYDQGNADDNFLDPHREDYSLTFPTATSTLDLGDNGVKLDLFQEATLQLRGSQSTARAPQIKILNTTGRIRVLAAGLEGFEADRRKGTFA